VLGAEVNDQDREELAQLRQLMDMRVYVTDDNELQCDFAGCLCDTDSLDLPARRTTMGEVANAVMEHRVKYLMVSS
jgi:hypothetical protein